MDCCGHGHVVAPQPWVWGTPPISIGAMLAGGAGLRGSTEAAQTAGTTAAALAIYAVIAYMDSVSGVFFPRGGMHAVPRAMAGAAEKHGVTLRLGETVTRVELRGSRAVAVHTSAGERIGVLVCGANTTAVDLG